MMNTAVCSFKLITMHDPIEPRYRPARMEAAAAFHQIITPAEII